MSDIPPKLVDAINNEKLAIFIGAGISRYADCESWENLAKKLVKKCQTENVINYSEQELLLKSNDKIKLISIAHQALENKKGVFIEEVRHSLKDSNVACIKNPSSDIKERRLYEASKLYQNLKNIGNAFITTNADRYFDQFFHPDNIVKNFKNDTLNTPNRGKLYKIHGCVSNEDSLVFSMNEYIDTYNSPNFNKFIEEIFGEYTVLILGYGLNELELLKNIVHKDRKTHYFINGYFKYEEKLQEFDKQYFKSLGIELMPYPKDDNGYDELKNFIDKLTTLVSLKTNKIQNDFTDIDSALEAPAMSNIDTIIQKINHDKVAEEYFFSQAPNYQNLYLWLEPLYKADFFNPAKNPHPQEDKNNKGHFNIPLWNVLLFLESVSLQNKIKPNSSVTKILLKIVDVIITYQEDDSFRVDNYHTDQYMIRVVFNLPYENISLDHIEFISLSLRESRFGNGFHDDIEKIVIPVLVENKMQERLIELLKVIFLYEEDRFDERIPLISKYLLEKMLDKYAKEISKQIGTRGLDALIKIIHDVIAESDSAFNIAWIATIEEHKQNSFPDRYDNQLISFTRDVLESLNDQEAGKYIEKFFHEKHPIFKRLAFHAINRKYDSLKDLLWLWLDQNIQNLNSNYQHEFCELLSDNKSKFSEEELDILINWIEGLEYGSSEKDTSEEDIKKYTAYKRKRWLTILKGGGDRIDNLYQKYDYINPAKIEHPCFDRWIYGARFIGVENPVENLCDKSVEEIASEINGFNINSFKADDELSTDRDVLMGLASQLENCIKENPGTFSKQLVNFNNLDYIYKYHIIRGFTSAWKGKQKFDWDKVFDFILSELTVDFFESIDPNTKSFRRECTELIEYGTKEDRNTFDAKYLPKAKKILFKLINNKESEEEGDIKNGLSSHVLNSTNGKTLHALMNYALRYGRLHSNKSIRWEEDVEDFFTKQLGNNDVYSLSVFLIFGSYLSNFQFLNKEWVDLHFNDIFPIDKERLWLASIEGYFKYSSNISAYLYDLLNKGDHIKAALESEMLSDDIKRKVVQQVCVIYLHDKDSDTIFDIIRSKNQNSILEIISFIWFSYKDESFESNNLVLEKINKLWSKIYSSLKDDQSKCSQVIFSNLSKWFVFLDEIEDDLLPQLELTVKNVNQDHNSHYLIEEMNRLVVTNQREIGGLYLSMVKNNIFPQYKEDNIKKIIECLFSSSKSEDLASVICNIYKQNGVFFLNELCKKHTTAS